MSRKTGTGPPIPPLITQRGILGPGFSAGHTMEGWQSEEGPYLTVDKQYLSTDILNLYCWPHIGVAEKNQLPVGLALVPVESYI